LKEKDPKIQCYVADPPGNNSYENLLNFLGSVLYSYYAKGKLERTGTGSITEGIGQGRVTENMKGKNCLENAKINLIKMQKLMEFFILKMKEPLLWFTDFYMKKEFLLALPLL
jgi:cysteine synthase